MLATVRSFAVLGLEAAPVAVEVDLAQGLPGLTIVGLPDKAVEEARERVRSAITNSDADFPLRRITVNLAPADLKKAGSAYDVPIALGILASDGQLERLLPPTAAVVGELALDGTIRPVRGILSIALVAAEHGITDLFVPAENAQEAAVTDSVRVYGLRSLRALIDHLSGQREIAISARKERGQREPVYATDFTDVRGQQQAKRALEIAAAGGHNVLFTGPPGAGKSMLAKAFVSILPPLSETEMLEVTRIHSVAGMVPADAGLVLERPVRTPHHTASAVALIGGGAWPRPGEISLAHRGVLFLDELPEFPRSVLEVLRQPLEEGVITISRAAHAVSFPAKFVLLAAQNPCPCGYAGTPKCTCTPQQVQRYQRKLSGPLLDRIDLHVHLPSVAFDELESRHEGEASATIRERVRLARERQRTRYEGKHECNADIGPRDIVKHCQLGEPEKQFMRRAMDHYGFSARVYHRILKLARTIADLADQPILTETYLAEAIQYRPHAQ